MDTAVYTALEHGGRLRDRAYIELKHRLLRGDLPLGARLAEERLGALLEVSRTPVREALQRLHADGLVEVHPEGGFRPAVPKVAHVRELYEVRIALELAALGPPDAPPRHDPAVVEPLRDRWRALAADCPPAEPRFVALDETFHETLAESAGNLALVGFLRMVNERIRVVRMQDFLSQDRMQKTADEHLGLAEAVLAGRIAEAIERFRLHVGASLAVVEHRVIRALAHMASQSEVTG